MTIKKEDLYQLLLKRLEGKEKSLSQIPNPSLLKDAKKAAKRVADAIQNKEKITLIGDYDVDGVTSCAIMVDFFRQIPYKLDVVIPNRFKDGYGISQTLLERVDADLIITVDNGITAIDPAKICKAKGIDLIITDHHTPPQDLPDAYAIVDPKLDDCTYPFKDICGAEVAWLLLGLIKKELDLNIDMGGFLDLLSLAIIADIMPLIDINRSIVKKGLSAFSKSNRASSVIIRDFLGVSKITSEHISFQIAPRLNSAGRMEDASIALEFLVAKTPYEAYDKFEILNELNELRKEMEAKTTKEAISMVDENDTIIVVAKDGWHEGVVGIVASRLVEKFSKPAIVLSINKDDAKGSGRSLGEVDIYKLIKANQRFLTKFGGHKMAAGVGLKTSDIEKFKIAINESAKEIPKKDFIPIEKTSGVLETEDIDIELLNLMETFEPYGEANPRPTFILKDAEVVGVKLLGADKSHSKIEVRQYPHQQKTVELIAFKHIFKIPKNRKISCSYSVTKNEFNGKISPQLLINKIFENDG